VETPFPPEDCPAFPKPPIAEKSASAKGFSPWAGTRKNTGRLDIFHRFP